MNLQPLGDRLMSSLEEESRPSAHRAARHAKEKPQRAASWP